jgi:hypothetical protein
MTRWQTIGILAIGVVACVAAVVWLVVGIRTLFDAGLFAAIPTLVLVPAVLGFVGYRAIRFAGPLLANDERRDDANLRSLQSFVQRAQSRHPSSRHRR